MAFVEKDDQTILLEIASLAISFSTGFLAGRLVHGISGSVWLELLSASCANLAILWLLSGLLNEIRSSGRKNRSSGQSAEPAPLRPRTPAQTETSAAVNFTVIFLAAYGIGRYSANRCGNTGWGIAAGVLAIAGIAIFFVWADRKIKSGKALAEKEQLQEGKEGAERPSASYSEDLVWAEPREYRSEDLRETRRWVINMVLFIVAACLFFIGVAYKLAPGSEAVEKLLITSGSIILFFLGLLGMTRLMRIIVKITDTAVVRDFGEEPATYPFTTIDHCELGASVIDGKTFSVLVVELKNNDREFFGIDPAIPIDRVRSTLERRGVNVVLKRDPIADETEK